MSLSRNQQKVALVVTTIGGGRFLEDFTQQVDVEGLRDDVTIIVIPDVKTPKQLYVRCRAIEARGFSIRCPTLEEQEAFLAGLGRIQDIIPLNSDNRRNVGFLMALEAGCDVMVSVDDDNYPRPEHTYFAEHLCVGQEIEGPTVHSSSGWFNICDLMTVEPVGLVYPRGFPYTHRHKGARVTTRLERGLVHVNAGLWLGHPDVDGVTCLAIPAKASAYDGNSVFLGHGTWTPINTQNTAIAREAIAAYYFLRMGYPLLGMPIDRDGDIFSGYFLQACAQHLGYRVRVGTPASDHRRNSHNYLKDMTFELACIWIFEDFADWVREAKLDGSTYMESYRSLADQIEDAVERFTGFIWTDATRGYFHYAAHCMRTWLDAVRTVGAHVD